MKPRARPAPAGAQAGISLLEIMIAMVVIGVGVGLFLTMQNRTGSNMSGNGKMMRAGQMVEKHIEAIRIGIARDTMANWPPRDTAYTESGLKVVRTVSEARSPKTAAVLPNVRMVDLTVSWGTIREDSLDVTTYVSRRF
jgi:Tfp pilus assembly protein PilV